MFFIKSSAVVVAWSQSDWTLTSAPSATFNSVKTSDLASTSTSPALAVVLPNILLVSICCIFASVIASSAILLKYVVVSTDPSPFKNWDEVPELIANLDASNSPVAELNLRAVLLLSSISVPVAFKANTGKQVVSVASLATATLSAWSPTLAHATPSSVDVSIWPEVPTASFLSVRVPAMSIFVTAILGVPVKPSATPGLMLAVPSNEVPPIVLAFWSAVAVAAFPVQDPDEPDVSPVNPVNDAPEPLKLVAVHIPVTTTPPSAVLILSVPAKWRCADKPSVKVARSSSSAAFTILNLAVDITRSGTRREEMLFKNEDLLKMNVLRKILSSMGTMDAIEFLLSKLRNTKNNADFFVSMNKPS